MYIPINDHPGAFGYNHKHDIHTGVDIYCNDGDPVYALENGIVVSKNFFTGDEVGTPWWNTTQYLMIKGESGIICYGEIITDMCVGNVIKEGNIIGYVTPVLPEMKIRSDIPNHSNSMLHIELYSEICEPVEWLLNTDKPKLLLDPTELLLKKYKL